MHLLFFTAASLDILVIDYLHCVLCCAFAEVIREQKRMVERSVHQLDREKASLQRDEQRLIADIKKNAQKNQMVHAFLVSSLFSVG